MAKGTAHYGEFHDDVVYTHKRIATLLDVKPEWVTEHILRLGVPQDSEERGVRYRKIGSTYFICGTDLRMWFERGNETN